MTSVEKSDTLIKESEKELDRQSWSQAESGFINMGDGQTFNPFVDPIVAEHYREVYEKSKYECRQYFDPIFAWTKEEEAKVVSKLEYKVTLFACVMFCAMQVDRGNLSQAISDNMLDDLNLTTDEYNYGNTILLVAFLLAELPSQLVSKKIGPDRWIPIEMLLWSIVSMCQAGLTGKRSFYATRALLGLLQGGFIPDLVLWLSYFYTSKELPLRLSFLWTTLSLTRIFTSLLAFGLLRMRGIKGLAGWQWLFLIEGLFTFTIGLISWCLMVPSVAQTKTKWNPKGWFTEREEKIIVNKILRDDPSKGDMNNRQPVTPKALWKAICDYNLWPVYLLALVANIPNNAVSKYMTLDLRNLGFDTFNTNLLNIPNNVIHIFTLIGMTYLSEKLNERCLVLLLEPLWTIPLVGVLAFWNGAEVNKWGTWVVITLILSSPYIHAICVAWVSRNSNTIRSRTVSAALYNIFVQLNDVIGSNIYRSDDAPKYTRGDRQLFAIAFLPIPILVLAKVYYIYMNKRRDAIWAKMTLEERIEYKEFSKDEGNSRLDFRFAH